MCVGAVIMFFFFIADVIIQNNSNNFIPALPTGHLDGDRSNPHRARTDDRAASQEAPALNIKHRQKF